MLRRRLKPDRNATNRLTGAGLNRSSGTLEPSDAIVRPAEPLELNRAALRIPRFCKLPDRIYGASSVIVQPASSRV